MSRLAVSEAMDGAHRPGYAQIRIEDTVTGLTGVIYAELIQINDSLNHRRNVLFASIESIGSKKMNN